MPSRRDVLPILVLALAFGSATPAGGKYIHELHVGSSPDFQFHAINSAIARMMELDPNQELAKCIYVHPGRYWEQLNDAYAGSATGHHETNGHNLPLRCDLIGAGGTTDQIVILHYSGYDKIGCTDKDRIGWPGIVCNGDNLLAGLTILNINLEVAEQKPQGVSRQWGWVQNSIEFRGPGKLENCIVRSSHQGVTALSSLKVTNCQITGAFLACIYALGDFFISNCTLSPLSDPSNMEWPVGLYARASGVVSNVLISSKCLFDQSEGNAPSLAGITLALPDRSDIVRISDARITLTLTKRSQSQVNATVFGIGTTQDCQGRVVVQDSTISAAGYEEMPASPHVTVYGVYTVGGTVELWGRISIDVATGGHTPDSCAVSLCNEGAVLAADPDTQQVAYDRNKTFGKITDLTRVMNRSRGSAHTSIRQAIDLANPSDVIELLPGVHHEPVAIVGKPLQIRAALEPEACGILGTATIDPNHAADAVLFGPGAGGSTLNGLVIRNGICGVKCDRSACTITNCWIYGNTNGVSLISAAQSDLRNNTIVHNTGCGILADAASAPRVTNCILWHNGDDLSGCRATYSCIEDGDTGFGNINTNPRFIDDDNDFHLQVVSPCIDAGNPAAPQEALDIDGDTRLVAAAVDMGADEVYIRARNITTGAAYLRIADATDQSEPGDIIEVVPGRHRTRVYLNGKGITLRSAAPDNLAVVRSTVLLPAPGAAGTVQFTSAAGRPTTLSGVTVRGRATAVSCRDHAKPIIDRCIIEGSFRSGLSSDLSSPRIRGCRIAGNGYFGVVASRSQLTVENTWIYNNATGILSGLGTINSLNLLNSTISRNGVGVRLTHGSAVIDNCILWNNSHDLLGCTAAHSCVGSSANANGHGNIFCDPYFVTSDSNDFHLQTTSPCIDAGNPDYMPPDGETDIDGEPRVADGRLDIGADEVVLDGQTDPIISGCVRDVNGSAIVGVAITFGDETVTTDTNGYYHRTVPYRWSGIVTPAKLGYSFDPPSRSYENIVHGVEGENYTGLTYAQSPSGSLAEALDTELSFICGGDSRWFLQSDVTYDGTDAARSGHISHGQASWFETTVDTEGTISFYWKVSSEESCDFLQFYIDDVLLERIAGQSDWEVKTYTVDGPGIHTLRWCYVKDRTVDAGDDCAWVDLVRWQPSAEPPHPQPLTISQALDTELPFASGGDSQWSAQTEVTYDGVDAARTGPISDGQVSWIETSVETPGEVSFYWRVSSEETCDYLEFYVDGALCDRISGQTPWQQKSYTLTGWGAHTLRWCYVKDGSVAAGDDCGWVDHLQWQALPTPPPPITPAPEPPTISGALDTELPFDTGGDSAWSVQSDVTYDGVDAVRTGPISDAQASWIETSVETAGTVSFYWKVSSEDDYDCLEFYVDDMLRDKVSGRTDWQQRSYTVTGWGAHKLKWRYVKDESTSDGQDCGWLDSIRWTPQPSPQ